MMTLKTGHAPYLRRGESCSLINLDVLITLIPLCIFSCVYYGLRPMLIVLTGMLTAVACETLCCLMMKRRPTILDGSAAVIGGLIGALMPPAAPYWLPIIASAFAILVAKMPFGGSGRYLLNPAAAGIAVVTLCFTYTMFRYPDPGLVNQSLPLGDLSGVVTESSPAAQLSSGGQTLYSWNTLLFGDFPGPIGATAIAVLAACALYLFSRRAISPLITLSYLAVCALIAVAFPRVSGEWYNSVMLELCTGYLLFCGIYLLPDTVTAPRHWLARIVYGAAAGALVMALRHIGQFEEGACFAVLLVNAFSPLLDRFCWRLLNLRRLHRRRRT